MADRYWTGDGDPAWELWGGGMWLAAIVRKPAYVADDGFYACFRAPRAKISCETAASALLVIRQELHGAVPDLPTAGASGG